MSIYHEILPWTRFHPGEKYSAAEAKPLGLCGCCEHDNGLIEFPHSDLDLSQGDSADTCTLCHWCECGSGKWTHRVRDHFFTRPTEFCDCGTTEKEHGVGNHYCLVCYTPVRKGLWFCTECKCHCGDGTHGYYSHLCPRGDNCVHYWYDSEEEGYEWKKQYDYWFCCEICPCVTEETPSDYAHSTCDHRCRICDVYCYASPDNDLCMDCLEKEK